MESFKNLQGSLGLLQQLDLLSSASENSDRKKKPRIGSIGLDRSTGLLSEDVPHDVPSERDASHSRSSITPFGAIENVWNGTSNVVVSVNHIYNKKKFVGPEDHF